MSTAGDSAGLLALLVALAVPWMRHGALAGPVSSFGRAAYYGGSPPPPPPPATPPARAPSFVRHPTPTWFAAVPSSAYSYGGGSFYGQAAAQPPRVAAPPPHTPPAATNAAPRYSKDTKTVRSISERVDLEPHSVFSFLSLYGQLARPGRQRYRRRRRRRRPGH